MPAARPVHGAAAIAFKDVDLYDPHDAIDEKMMALVSVLRGGQITLPAEVRQKLKLARSDYLEVEVVEHGLLLKPVSDVEREKAWRRVLDAPKAVATSAPSRGPVRRKRRSGSPEEIKAARLKEHAHRRR